MDQRNLFIELTATDAWLTAEQIVTGLKEAGYWERNTVPWRASERLAHVTEQLEQLVDEQGRRLFVSLAIVVNGETVPVYKQERRILQRHSQQLARH